MRNKNDKADEISDMADFSENSLREIVKSLLDSGDITSEQREMLTSLVSTEAGNMDNVAHALMGITERKIIPTANLTRKDKKKAKAKNALASAYNARDLNERIIELKTLVLDNKAALDLELGTFVNTATGKRELYTDWFLRTGGFTHDSLTVVINDLMGRSESMQGLLLQQFYTRKVAEQERAANEDTAENTKGEEDLEEVRIPIPGTQNEEVVNDTESEPDVETLKKMRRPLQRRLSQKLLQRRTNLLLDGETKSGMSSKR